MGYTLEAIIDAPGRDPYIVECDNFEPESDGVVLKDPGDIQLGFVPYEKLHYIRPKPDD